MKFLVENYDELIQNIGEKRVGSMVSSLASNLVQAAHIEQGRPRRNQNKTDSSIRGFKIYSHHKKIKPTGEKWTCDELIKLNLALCTYGSSDVVNITRYIGTRSFNDVIGKMKHFQRLAQCSINNSKSERIKIYDKWIHKLRSLDVSPRPGQVQSIALALKIIELYEEHPDPADVYGIDFKKAYRWFYDCYCGNATSKLDLPTSAFLSLVCDKLMEKGFFNSGRSVQDLEKLLSAIGRLESEKQSNENLTGPPLKTYPGKKKKETFDEDLAIYKSLLNNDPNMNPLGLPHEFWTNF